MLGGDMGTYTAKCDICFAENQVPNYGDWTCSQCRQPYDYDEGHRIHLNDAQMDDLRTPPRWIPVTERLPADRTVVLAWNGKRVAFGYVRDGSWIDTLYGWFIPNGPTHWMPLPEPPTS